MNRKIIILTGAFLVAAALAGFIFIPKNLVVVINGQEQILRSNAFTIAQALEQDGFTLSPEDRIQPGLDASLFTTRRVEITLARPVTILVIPPSVELELFTAERDPLKILVEANLEIGPDDRLLLSSQLVDPSQTLPYQGEYQLTMRKAVQINLNDNGSQQTISSAAATLADALSEASITLTDADHVSLPLDTALDGNLDVEIRRAQPVTILLKDQRLAIQSAAKTVAEALADAGLALQSLDYSIPAEDQPISENGEIRLVRVREEFLLSQTNIPYQVEYIKSDQVELDQMDVVQPGEFGVEVTRTRVVYHDDLEVSKTEEITWVAKEPVDQVTGMGTQVVVRKMDTPNGEIEYWRAVNVYATSYSPCQLGIPDYCSSGTSSGLTVQHGVIAVTRAWYNLLVGQRLYVPGYGIGVIGDVGGGIPGKYWIDLAYSDADYVAWYHNVTVYFLTPIPANIPWILP